ncbi:hypothetical protein AVEN_106869-1 [Araneus ventricosus]|uniref:Uncharacterized protein n=1 Tax=Araneus ventricosus TaxID=182803 RepID=A0A4Y2R8P5_ARAVE|nr:hypothetical protein AVEN_8405-1 [Araneus ventricosus]GBN71195.1 hypothetical protein AVEN_106869-1 [Araneus ventricosus]
MPHRGVVKELKETTKLRICYDASSKANKEMSLNNRLDCSPNINPDLLKIILKFGFCPIEFCADIQGEFLELGILEEEHSDIPLKDLELIWGSKKDTLKVAFNLLQQLSDKIPTKGAALSACGVPCDPLDILTPFTVRIKLLIQKLWENGFTWDEPLPPDIEFKEWPHELTFVQDVVVPHPHFSVMKTELLEVDKSSGGSHKVYCSVDNFRMKHSNDAKTNFIVSKSRLTLLRTVTLHRLEFLGSVALARL